MKQAFYTLFIPLCLTLGAVSCDKDNSTATPNSASGASGTTGNFGGSNTTGNFNGGTSVGQGGSLARFTIAQNHLYVVDNSQLYTYSLSDPKKPVRISAMQVGFNVETIFPYKDKLFIGSQQAMFIYSISNPAQPVMLSQSNHFRACDPVVANDSMAYVTIRTGTNCGGTQNSLLVYNVRNVLQPQQVNTVGLTNPSGLGLGANKRLYVCDAAAGLKVFNLNNPNQPSLIKTITGRTFHDIIVLDDLLVCFVDGGTALYTLGSNDDIQFAANIAN